jgi:hypothetical protein
MSRRFALEEHRKQCQMSFGDLHMLMMDVLQRQGGAGLERYMEENYATILPIMPADKPSVRKKFIEILASHQPAHYRKLANSTPRFLR